MGNKKFKIIISITSIAICVCAGLYFTLNNLPITLAAQGSAGNEGKCIGSDCSCYRDLYRKNVKDLPFSQYQDVCFGGGWQEYTTDKDELYIPGNQKYETSRQGIEGGTIKDCATYGGKYYRLALYNFDTQGLMPSATNVALMNAKYASESTDPNPFVKKVYKLVPGYEGEQVGFWPVRRFKPATLEDENAKGDTQYRKDAANWNEVREKFETAKKHGATMNNLNWMDVSWFCYNDEWDEAEFASTSSVQTNDSRADFTTEKDGFREETLSYEVSGTEQKVDLTFWHKLWYVNNVQDATSVFPDVQTNWDANQTSPKNIFVEKGTFTTNGKPNTEPGTSSDQLALRKVQVCLQGKDNAGEATGCEDNNTENTAESSDYFQTIKLAPGKSTKICHKIHYQPKYISFEAESEDSNQLKVASTKEDQDSEACLTIRNDTKYNSKVESHQHKGFWSVASIYVPEQNGDVPEFGSNDTRSSIHSNEDGNGKVELTFSTDAEQTTVYLWHNMYYTREMWDTQAQAKHTKNDIFISNICSTWNITGTGGANSEQGTFCTDKKGDNSGKRIGTGASTPIVISLAKGEEKTICSKNQHNKTDVTINQTWKSRKDVNDKTIWYWEDSEGASSGTGFSEACVTIYRPDDPKEGNGLGSQSHQGISNNTLMYAGETAKINWATQANPHNTRRLEQYRAVAYVVPASVDYSNAVDQGLKGNLADRMPAGSDGYPGNGRVNIDPCHYTQDLWSNTGAPGTWCDIVPGTEENLNGSTSPHSYSGGEKTIIVPDYTGYKYCNTSGYQWAYYYQIAQDGNGNWTKYGEGEYNNRVPIYWTNYSSACRTIAKKPEVAFWNGGVKTAGSIITTLYKRHTPNPSDDQHAPVLAGNNPTFLYGSWAEYLVSPEGSLSGFASGAALSPRHFVEGNKRLYPDLSYLTISNLNESDLGKSQISSRSVLETRLQLYLDGNKSFAADSITSLNNINWNSNQGRPKILNYGSSVNINSNIELPDGPYDDIRQIPRLIIYTSGDVNISNNATRIDAWILAPNGLVNTCSEFQTAQSETRTADTSHSSAASCDQQLKINGPVIADGIVLNRTYGADPVSYREGNDEAETKAAESDRFSPAEIFSLGADDYLWAYAQAGRYNSSYTDAYTRELPPRY